MFAVLMLSQAGEVAELWQAMQIEIIYALVAGMELFFPLQPTHGALLLACVRKQRTSSQQGNISPLFNEFVGALCLWLAAQPSSSGLLIPEAEPSPPDVLHGAVPRALKPDLLSHPEIQRGLTEWLLGEVEREARSALDLPAADAEPSPCLRLLTCAMQEVLAKASLSSSGSSDHHPQSDTTLIFLSEQLLARAAAVLDTLPAPTAEQRAALQLVLGS
eukprot:3052347-Prymnesium_polylepis.1